jgi:CBS domain-containing protein
MLPVIENGRLRGVITDRDIVIRAVARDVEASSTRVGECLTPHVICARPEWTTDQAMHAMSEAQVGRLPVVDDQDQLVGVVTLSSMAFRAPDKGEALETAQEVSRRSARAAA